MPMLPGDYWGLVQALTPHVRDAEAGLLTPTQDEDPEVLWAALDEASRQVGRPVRQGWIGHDRAALAWVFEDDERIRRSPWLAVVGVNAPGV